MSYLPSTHAPTKSSFKVDASGSAQVIGTGSFVPISWTTEIYDSGDEFSGNVFTPKEAGKYAFRGSLLFSSSENGTIAIMLNGVPAAQRKSTGDLYLVNTILEMNVGDVVWLAFNRMSGNDGTIAGFAPASNFSGYKVYGGTR